MNNSTGLSRLTSGQIDVIAKPRIIRPAPVAVYLHSNAGSATEGFGGNFLTAVQNHLSSLADKLGLTIVAPTSPITFGSGTPGAGTHTTPQERLDDAIAYHKANLLGTNDPYLLVATSGGVVTALRRCGLLPSDVGCAITFLSVGCLEVVHRDDIGGNAAALTTTYGYPFASQSDPAHQFTDTVPKLLTHGSTDAYSTSSGHVIEDDYATGRGASFVSVSGGAHDNTSVVGVPVATVVDFAAAHLAL